MNGFEITSGAMRLTDPCYDLDVWCAGDLENVRNGKWFAEAIRIDDPVWGNRVARLVVRHESFADADDREFHEEIMNDFGVDSGQFGFFDRAKYAEQHGGKYNDETSFYGEVCKLTSGKTLAVRNFGAVSTSGCGDGVYPVYIERDDQGLVIGAVAIFMDEDEDDEDGE
jgi:hypothetical protein